jgi:hypothetical protein
MRVQRRKNYKGRNRWHPERMPAWPYNVWVAFGDAITYLTTGTVMRARLFVAASIDYITTQLGLPPSATQSPVEV